jgi:hypothetical protein
LVVIAYAAHEPGVPSTGGVAICLGLAAIALAQHLWFRAGRPMPANWMTPQDKLRSMTIRCSFAALPGVLVFGPVGILFGIVHFVPSLPFDVARIFIFAGAAFMVGGAAWAYKEFGRPTLRRTPPWLRHLVVKDPTLAKVVCGDRVPPWL